MAIDVIAPPARSTGGADRAARLREILAILDTEGAMPTLVLAQRVRVSGATIRRDLAALEERRLVVRHHGGVARTTTAEVPVELRDGTFWAAKSRIARRAADLLPAGPLTLAINGGTTTAEVAKALTTRHDLTVVTNSLTIALAFASGTGVRVVVNGGWLRTSSFELVGRLTESTFAAVRVSCAVIGVDGVSASAGLTTHDEAESRANRAMLQRADRVIVVADGSKIGRTTAAHMADASQITDLVTDTSAPRTELSRLAAAGVRVHEVAGP
ncbi:DeoR/GlpR family DNA-binding transcription regulator [Xylanimonas sp. McL0601]|uniref:DeoR/GlpR family DNA-binding transcription regulator n=1 Tax=Xylanimonas sp. McL0601 TaxID=3414739 RepID=UPI003CECCCA9